MHTFITKSKGGLGVGLKWWSTCKNPNKLKYREKSLKEMQE
jgi:hypothetical protein